MLVEKVRAIWGNVQSGRENALHAGDDAGGEAEPRSSLFQCSECDVVYIALEKDKCSSCREELIEVSPTLTQG
jgi:hypothetical protein